MKKAEEQRPNTLEYEVYLQERENLYKYHQANYENYEKTILTLSAAFLAFSLSFLGLVKKEPNAVAAGLAFERVDLLILAWCLFGSSVLATLITFLVNTLAYGSEISKIEDALEDGAALDRRNGWSFLGHVLYAVSGLAFAAGIALLLVFCGKNIYLF